MSRLILLTSGAAYSDVSSLLPARQLSSVVLQLL